MYRNGEANGHRKDARIKRLHLLRDLKLQEGRKIG